MKNKKAFSLVETLLVVTTIAVLMLMLLLTLNPWEKISKTRNAVRRSDVLTISKALYQYNIDNGVFPEGINMVPHEICRSGVSDCKGLIDLSVITKNNLYLTAIPVDPLSLSDIGTGYFVSTSGFLHPVVYSPFAELDESINSVTPSNFIIVE